MKTLDTEPQETASARFQVLSRRIMLCAGQGEQMVDGFWRGSGEHLEFVRDASLEIPPAVLNDTYNEVEGALTHHLSQGGTLEVAVRPSPPYFV